MEKAQLTEVYIEKRENILKSFSSKLLHLARTEKNLWKVIEANYNFSSVK